MRKILLVLVSIIVVLGITIALLEFTANYKASESVNKLAPVQTVQRIIINAPAEVVYKIMTDVNRWGSWNADIQQPVLINSFEKGNVFNWKTGGLTIQSTIHTAIPDQKIGWSGRAFGAFAIHNWTFVKQGNHTEVVVEESMEGWIVKLMPKKFQAGLEQSLQTWLKNLKTAAEAE